MSLIAIWRLRGLAAASSTRQLGAFVSHSSASDKTSGGDTERPGPATRSVQQAQAPDPAEAQGNTGSDPETTIKHAAWRANETMSSHYDDPEQEKGKSYSKVVPEIAEGLAAKVKDAFKSVGQALSGDKPDEYQEAAKKLRRDMEGIKEEGEEKMK